MSARRRAAAAGFTLAELIIALAIVAALLTIAFGALRVAMGAWQQGETRTEAHQHVRSVAMVLGRAVGGTYAYKGSFDETPDTRVLFRGEESRIEFVTQSPPAPFPIPIAFVAVVISLEPDEGLVIRQRALPNLNPFTQAEIVMKDPSVTALAFQYLDEEQGGWKSTYDNEQNPPKAVGITVSTTNNGVVDQLPPLTVPIRFPPE